ncbi:MAG: PQQ-binding-like beta-propeller repeat protein [Bryobacterales bacterium]|nr:PQQ-binding-like beta-propeller repeat protein [Bryobacterales bacterium]MBV9400780.1 PQQ-binding-like beta-propeller repeat protein [Bryobacterales bacterium]
MTSTNTQNRRRAALCTALCGTVAALVAIQSPAKLHAQAPAVQGRGGVPPADALFTSAQAIAGKAAYQRNCASCHGASVDDGNSAPPLRGAAFLGKYAGKPAADLFSYVSTKMPPSSPGSLGGAEYAQIIAYVLQQNGFATGRKEFASDAAELASVTIPGSQGGRGGSGAGGLSPNIKLPPAPKKANPLDKISPVTDALLQNPPAGEWLTWRRGFDYQGFSPLKQITKSNVNNLRVAWTWTLSAGANEATPLVHDGVMFLHSPGDKLEALDAATGDLLWQYARILPQGVNASNKRMISIYGNKVYMGTSDIHVVALDVKTGRVAWDEPLTEERGFTLTGGPLVAKGKVMIGTGGRVGGKNYIVALDSETGKLAWRFNTIAQPGEPGGDTWNDHTADERNGGSVWIAGSYDSALNLAFFGVAQTYDTALLAKPVRPEVKTDGLYTDCTLAINPDNGKLVWYYQHLPNDQWDLDWVFERQIVQLPVNGVVRPVIMTSGKQATYDVLDAETGKWIYSKDLGLQNIVTIDSATGKKTVNPQTLPGDGQTHFVCPHVDGAKSWLPGSYNPDTKILYIPLVEACNDLMPLTEGGGRGLLSTGVRPAVRPRPDSDGKYGRVEAVNMVTREVVWTERHRAPVSSGALDTAGGVIFNGSIDRFFRAYDDQTGKLLWETRLTDVPSDAPISYTVNGKQYIAIGVGNGGAQATGFAALVPEIQNLDRSAAVWVFQLP